MDKKEMILNLLNTAGAAIEAAFSMLNEDDGQCRHPIEDRIDLSVMGKTIWKCGVCGHIEGVD